MAIDSKESRFSDDKRNLTVRDVEEPIEVVETPVETPEADVVEAPVETPEAEVVEAPVETPEADVVEAPVETPTTPEAEETKAENTTTATSEPELIGGLAPNTWGVIIHISHLTGIGLIWGPLIAWLVTKDKPEMGKISEYAKEALNFHINIAAAGIIATFSIIFMIIPIIGSLIVAAIFMAIGVAGVVLPIMAALAINDGKDYEYPFIIRLIK